MKAKVLGIRALGLFLVASSMSGSANAALEDNLRSSLDLSTRVTTKEESDTTDLTHFMGLDAHKVFTSEEGDWATLVAQAYLIRKDPDAGSPDWIFTTRMLNLNVTGLKHVNEDLPNIRFGHYEIPFGLEHMINTNGTLHDFIHMSNLGLKPDWGIFLNDDFQKWEYEVGLSRGTGMHYRRSGDPYAVSGRIGTPRDENIVLGASFFHGELSSGKRVRYGVDAQRYIDAFGLLTDLSVGENEDASVFNALVEANWRNPTESWFLYAQGTRFSTEKTSGWEKPASGSLGLRYAPDLHWSFSAQCKKDLDAIGSTPKDTILNLQLRYRF